MVAGVSHSSGTFAINGGGAGVQSASHYFQYLYQASKRRLQHGGQDAQSVEFWRWLELDPAGAKKRLPESHPSARPAAILENAAEI
jgi:hypothetical protein